MALYAHREAPISLTDGTEYSAIEIIEAGIAHPLVANYAETSTEKQHRSYFVRYLVMAATGVDFAGRDASDDHHAAYRHPAWKNWCVATNRVRHFIEQLPEPIYQRVLNEIRGGREQNALTILTMFNNVVHQLSDEPIAAVA